MATAPEYEVRLIKKEEISQALELWKETGFHLGTKCFDTWFEVDPTGFYVAATESGELLGICTAVVLHEDLAFVGTYAVRERYRGQGIGPKIWKACYEHIGERNAAVNAVPGKKELYRDRGGFPVEETEWFSVSCETENEIDPDVLVKEVDGVEVRPVDDDNLPLVLEYDSALVGYSREKAISLTVHEDDTVSFLALQDGKCVGYGVLKTTVHGQGLVGPLYAASQDIAEVVLKSLIEGLPSVKGLAMMIINTNDGAKSIVSKLGLEWHTECPRCYKRENVDVDKNKVFGQLHLNFSPY